MHNYIAGEHYNSRHPSSVKSSTLKSLQDQFKLNIISNNGETLEFEIFNTPCSIQNTLRRILLNEVPSVAIDRVFMFNNTTVIEDSDLQLRIGLLPIDVDPDCLKSYTNELPNEDDVSTFQHDASLLFELTVNHKKQEDINEDRFKRFVDPHEKDAVPKFLETYKKRRDKSIYSNDLIWRPYPSQNPESFNLRQIDDILIDRIMPGEEIVVKALAVKGYGHDHAKFIPVSTANGRRAHTLKLLSPIKGESAKTLQKLFPPGVIEIKKGVAVVGDPKLIRRANKNFNEFEDLKGKVELGFDENHFFWIIESVRPTNQPSYKILISAFQSMINKCNFYQENLDKLLDAINVAKTGSVDCQAFGEKVNGKFCYIEKIDRQGFPFYQFHGETATLGVSLAFMLDYLFGKKVNCGYTDVQGGIEVTVNTIDKRSIDSDCALKDGLKALSEYFQHMMQTFQNQMSSFYENDVNME